MMCAFLTCIKLILRIYTTLVDAHLSSHLHNLNLETLLHSVAFANEVYYLYLQYPIMTLRHVFLCGFALSTFALLASCASFCRAFGQSFI